MCCKWGIYYFARALIEKQHVCEILKADINIKEGLVVVWVFFFSPQIKLQQFFSNEWRLLERCPSEVLDQ